jgi:phosphatidate cytidylyltransferase
MNNFWTRALTGAVFVVVMVGGIWWSYWSIAALFFAITAFGLWEFLSLVKLKGIYPQKILGTLLGISVMLFFTSINRLRDDYIQISTIAALCIFTAIILFELFRPSENPLANIALPVFGVFYIVLPFGLLLLPCISGGIFSDMVFNSKIVLGYFFLLWSNDTFAYLVGRTIGKTKLFERVSPKKTWEGTIGGVICTQGIAFLLSIYFTQLTLRDWIIVGAIVSIFGTLGDLVESMFKRSLSVKDSGTILPGHGGILDRFDGVFLSAPFAVAYIEMFAKISG